MKKDQKYINDLLRHYRDGSISAKDRHTLERIALDDPFVFDSMEGYTLSGNQNSSEAIDRIKSRTTLPQGRLINMRSISIAAGIAILIGGLFWVNGQLNQPNLESFSQLETQNDVEEIVAESVNENVDSVADFVGVEIGDLSGNGAPSELLGESKQRVDTEAAGAIINVNQANEPQESIVDESDNSSTIVAVPEETKSKESGKVNTEIDNSKANEGNVVARAESEIASAPTPVAPATTSAPPVASRTRSTEAVADVQKKKEIITRTDDSFGDAPVAEDQFDAESKIAMNKLQNKVIPKRMVSGLVRDITGEPLIGASILVPDSDIAVATDIDGSFSFEVDSTINQIEIGYVGYSDLVMTLDTSSTYDILLDENYASLDEVVVTGYASNINEPQPSFVLPPDGRTAYKKVIQSKASNGCDQSGKVRLKFTVNKYGK